MSILDDDSFESYFAVDTSPGGSRCTDVKGRYDSCFFKSYSESAYALIPDEYTLQRR